MLVNYGGASARFNEVQLGDCGDAHGLKPNADPLEEGHVIGAAIFRSPEAMLNLRWGPPTDIWSLGTTVDCGPQLRSQHVPQQDRAAP